MPRQAMKFDDWKAKAAAEGPKAEKIPTLKLVEKPEVPKTVEAVEVLATQEGLTPTEEKQFSNIDELAVHVPEAAQKVAQSKEAAVVQMKESKEKKKKGIKQVIGDKTSEAKTQSHEKQGETDSTESIKSQLEALKAKLKKTFGNERKGLDDQISKQERRLARRLRSSNTTEEAVEPAPVFEKPVSEPEVQVEPEVEKPKPIEDSVETERQRIMSKIKELEGMENRKTDDDTLLASWKQKLKKYNASHPVALPVEKDVEVKLETSLPPKETGRAQGKIEERPEGRISEVRELKPEVTETEAKAVEVAKQEPRRERSGLYLNLAVSEKATPQGWRYEPSLRKIKGGLLFDQGGAGGIHVEPRVARSLRVAEKPAAAEPEEILGAEDIIPEIKTLAREESPKTPESFSKGDWDLLTAHMSDPEIGKEVWEVLGGMRRAISELKGLQTDLVNISGYDKEELRSAKESRMATLRKQIKVEKDELQSFQPKFQELVVKSRAIDLAKEKVMEAEVKGREEETLGAEDIIPEVETPLVTEPITKVAEVKTLRGMGKPLAEVRTLSGTLRGIAPEATPAPEAAPVDEPIPEYRSTLLYSKKRGQLESRMSEVKNLSVNEWSETYAEPGGFDQALWDQLVQDKGKNEKKQFHELEFNLAEYAIKELEAQERLRATLYGISARAEMLEDVGLTKERRHDLGKQIKELQQAEKDARLEIKGIADLKNKARAEEKSLFIKAEERLEAAQKAALPKTPSVRVATTPKTPDSTTVLGRPATPTAPEEFEEEEKLVADLFEIKDKIKQVEKALQAQREVMPRSVLARGMGLEGNEEALKNAERIMKQHEVIKALEDQLSELEEEKEVLMGGKATSTEKKTAAEAAKTKDRGASKAGAVAKKIAIGTGIGAGGLLVGAGAAFAKLQYWARWQAPLAALEFLMKFTGDPGGMFKKGFDHFEKADPMKLLAKKKTEKSGKE